MLILFALACGSGMEVTELIFDGVLTPSQAVLVEAHVQGQGAVEVTLSTTWDAGPGVGLLHLEEQEEGWWSGELAYSPVQRSLGLQAEAGQVAEQEVNLIARPWNAKLGAGAIGTLLVGCDEPTESLSPSGCL